MSPVDARAPLTRSAILEAAARMARAEGLRGVSLRRLAGALGVTAPALYAHFDNKDDLLGALAAEEFGLLADRLAASGADVDDPVERIRVQSRAYVEHSLEHPAVLELMSQFGPSWVDQSGATELAEATRAFEVSTAAVSDAIADGRLRSDDELLVALTLWAAVHGLATVLASRPGLGDATEQALIDSVVDSVVQGLLAS